MNWNYRIGFTMSEDFFLDLILLLIVNYITINCCNSIIMLLIFKIEINSINQLITYQAIRMKTSKRPG